MLFGRLHLLQLVQLWVHRILQQHVAERCGAHLYLRVRRHEAARQLPRVVELIQRLPDICVGYAVEVRVVLAAVD